MDRAAHPPTYAGFVSRAVAFGVDLLVMSVAMLVVIALAEALMGFFTLYGVFGRSTGVSGGVRAAVTAVVAIAGVAIAVGYPVGCWVLLGQTLGKALTGLRVVRIDGGRVTVGRALLRYVGYWLSALPLFLGFFWVLGDPRRRGWHDLLAGTCVIYTFSRADGSLDALPGAAA